MKLAATLLAATLLAAAWLAAAPGGRPQEGYDPLAAPGGPPSILDLDVEDGERERSIPVRIYLPAAATPPAATILFSHGLGGSRRNNAYLGRHWSRRGYAAVFMQHPGSDEAVWRDAPLARRRAVLDGAANLDNFVERNRDVGAVLDALEAWNKTGGHVLHGRLDPGRIGMSGHSFGAVTAQAVAGQRFPLGAGFRDRRIQAAAMMSPSAPASESGPAFAFGSVEIPWLLMTGTKDDSPIGRTTPESRLRVYPALPPGGKYELVLHDARHTAFGDVRLFEERGSRNPNHRRAILAIATAFFDAHLLQQPEAAAWLHGDSVRQVLQERDRWQWK